jgi:lysyl-tRNA synthetase, class II
MEQQKIREKAENLDEQTQRQQRLAKIRALGWDAYPAQVQRTHTIGQLLGKAPNLSKGDKQITLVGRVRALRNHGASTFAHLEDGTGRFQLYFKKDEIGAESYKNFNDLIDRGDFLGVDGTLFTTKKGEPTLLVKNWRLLGKTLRPLPEKWHGLQDTEIRFRQRYLDLLMNDEVRRRMILRSAVIDSIRATMKKHDFLEVETPTIQPVYGGGFARPFTTHHNSLDADFYLRISDEMYLKRLLVGGFERVYEITKVFRNEGLDRHHNPEFTMFEAQAAYQDYGWGMNLFEEIFEEAAQAVLGTTKIRNQETTVDLKRPWQRMKLTESVKKIAGLDPPPLKKPWQLK